MERPPSQSLHDEMVPFGLQSVKIEDAFPNDKSAVFVASRRQNPRVAGRRLRATLHMIKASKESSGCWVSWHVLSQHGMAAANAKGRLEGVAH